MIPFLTSLNSGYHTCSSQTKSSCYFPLFFRSLTLTILVISLVQSFKSPSSKNISNTLHINSHITNKPTPKFEMNYLSMEPVLFEKLHNIKLSHLVFRVTTSFFQFDHTKSTLNTLLKYTQDLDETLKSFYSKLVTNNYYDHKS